MLINCCVVAVGYSAKNDANIQGQDEKKARGERTAENIRYGESISKHGFGGETVGNSGGVDNAARNEGNSARKVSGYREQGRSEGDEVGA